MAPSTPVTQFKTGPEWLSACRLYARRNASCLTSGFLSLVTREASGLGTMAVTKDGKLLYDPDLRKVWTVKQGATVLFHELWHVLRRHHARREVCGAEPGIWNIANDAEINDDIPVNSHVWEFPELTISGNKSKHVMPSYIFEFIGEPGGMPDGQLAEGYWEALRDRQKKQKESGHERGTCCGSGAGNPVPGEPDGKGRTSAELERVRRDVAETIKTESAKGRGTIPGGWSRWADEQLAPPKIPWQTKLAKIARGSVEWAAGAVDYRYNATSRRQAGVGFGPGRPILPALRAPKPEVLIAVDTSGSMGADELKAALSEVKGILNTTAASVTFAACDADIHALRKVKHFNEIIPMVKGGGGTSFIPIFDAASKLKPRPNVVVVCTDGDGSAPDDPPVGMRVIWILVGAHARKAAKWGESIFTRD